MYLNEVREMIGFWDAVASAGPYAYYHTFTDYNDTVVQTLQGHCTWSVAKVKSVRPTEKCLELSSEGEK